LKTFPEIEKRRPENKHVKNEKKKKENVRVGMPVAFLLNIRCPGS
jgi:hypothetical protein